MPDTMDITTPNANDINKCHTEIGKENLIEIEIPFPLFQYLSSEECNLQNICRICLSVNHPVLYPLFSNDEQSVLATMFMAISEVQMSTGDGLPSHICLRCQTDMMNYYEFKMKCVKADYTLKSVLKGDFNIEKESSENKNDMKTSINNDSQTVKVTVDNENIDTGCCSSISKHPEEKNIGIDYLENIKESMSDDEALCVVQETDNNQKEITILKGTKHTKSLSKDINKSKTELSKNSKEKVKHQCRFCPKKYHKAKTLRKHVNKCHSASEMDGQYACTECKEAFDSESDLKLHAMLHNQSSGWKCAECQKEFKGRTALRRHIERHMQRRRFVCERCGAAFVEKYALRRHLRVHAPQAQEKKFACTQCDKRFVSNGTLATHMSTHATTRDCICGVCGASFASQRLLASHERVHSTDKPYACTYCDKRFRHESTRNTHVRTHTGERPYVCVYCGNSFIQHSNMALHMRTHTGEKPYECSYCERKFSSSSTLKAHKRTHTGERPYSCKVCGKSFARVSMKNHMRLHSGERPHACPAPACARRFLTAHRLRDHYRLHTGEKPFECANCSQKFATKCQLLTHMKKHKNKEKASKKGVMLVPVTVSDKTRPTNNPQIEYQTIETFDNTNAANMNEAIIENPIQSTENLIYQDDTNIKTEVIVLDSAPNLVSNQVVLNDLNYINNDVNVVTVNEGEMSISSASTTVDGMGQTVKLYQYDQSLLQIHTGGGQLTISRISSKMTTNF